MTPRLAAVGAVAIVASLAFLGRASAEDRPPPPAHTPTGTTVPENRDPNAAAGGDFAPPESEANRQEEDPTGRDREPADASAAEEELTKDCAHLFERLRRDPQEEKPECEGVPWMEHLERPRRNVLDWAWSGIRNTIDGWFESLAEKALKPVLDLVGRTIFATPDVTVPGTVRDFWSYSLVIADAALVLFVIIAGLVLMGHETVQTRTTIKEVAPRIVFAAVAMNASLGFVGMLIRAANTLSVGFLDVEPESGHGATELLINTVIGLVTPARGIFLALLGIVVAGLGIAVLCTYVARVATVVVLVGAAPLFLVFHAVPHLEGAARLWWRSLVGCLATQVCQCLVMAATVRVFFHNDGRSLAGMPGGGTMDLLIVGSLLWLMLRIPSYAGRMVFAPRSSNPVTRQVMHSAMSRGLGAVTRAVA